MLFNYRIDIFEDGEPSLMQGNFTLDVGEKRVVCHLPKGHLQSVTASTPLHIAEGEKVFMNGYQSRTYCPEYAAKDVLRPRGPLPKWMVDKFRLDRSGDYHFVDYPAKPGLFHGFSYCYFRYHDTYRLIASLDERPGYTIFRYDAGKGELTVERDCAGLRCNGDFHAFDLLYAVGTEDEVFDAWFDALGVHARTAEQLAGYTSRYVPYQGINEKTIRDDLAGCVDQLEGGDLFEIDDGWQTCVGDWMRGSVTRFPSGMKASADAIHQKGMRAGLWLAPFVAQEGSALLREHPDWFLQRDGKPWACGGKWGGIYALDFDHPAARGYLSDVFYRVLEEWGFDVVKLDCLYAAAPFGSEDESRAARMTRALELLRSLCGYKPIIACAVPLMPAFGVVEYCRVGCDVTTDWDDKPWRRLLHRERPSTRQAVSNAVFRRALNGRAFLLDPDAFFLREEGVHLTKRQRDMLAAFDAVIGGVFLHADDMSRYPQQVRERYCAVRRMRGAREVQVETDGKWLLHCELDGQPCELPMDDLP